MEYTKDIVIVIKGGMVQDVYFERPFTLNAVVVDLDCDEGCEASRLDVLPYDRMGDELKKMIDEQISDCVDSTKIEDCTKHDWESMDYFTACKKCHKIKDGTENEQ